jgi:hypothetical protein
MDKKKLIKKVLIGLLILFLIMQLLQPERNVATTDSPDDITQVYQVPVEVHQILKQKCYDCHSNYTKYPWYVYIQPVGWWMASHIKEGKEELNFSAFKTYNQKKAAHKLEEVSEAVTEGWMPLESYTFIHKETKVTPEDARVINAWIQSLGIVKEEEGD